MNGYISRVTDITNQTSAPPRALLPAGSVSMYRRLLGFLRPYSWLMIGNVVFSLVAAGLEVFSFTLLIPFLSLLFGKADFNCAKVSTDFLQHLQQQAVCSFVDESNKS